MTPSWRAGAAIAFSFPAAIGGYFAGGAVLVAVGLMLYGSLGMIVIPFSESVPADDEPVWSLFMACIISSRVKRR